MENQSIRAKCRQPGTTLPFSPFSTFTFCLYAGVIPHGNPGRFHSCRTVRATCLLCESRRNRNPQQIVLLCLGPTYSRSQVSSLRSQVSGLRSPLSQTGLRPRQQPDQRSIFRFLVVAHESHARQVCCVCWTSQTEWTEQCDAATGSCCGLAGFEIIKSASIRWC